MSNVANYSGAAASTLDFPEVADPEVSLVIPTTNQAEALERCLKSLQLNLPADIASEIIVVLNAATSQVETLARAIPGLRLAHSAANLGVAGSCNLGRHLARGRYLLLLHDDVEIEPGWLEGLLATSRAHPEAGAIGSRVLNLDGSLQRAGSYLWSTGITSRAEPPPGTDPYPVDYLGTCSMLVPVAWWDAVGGMDEAIYPAYYVDVDICSGLQEAGAVILCAPSSVLRHRGGSSTPDQIRRIMCERNRALFMAKRGHTLTGRDAWDPRDPELPLRARRRTSAQALSRAENRPSPHPDLPPLDPAAQQVRHTCLEREWQAYWQQHLLEDNELLSRKLASLSEKYQAQKQKLQQKNELISRLKARCTALKAQPRQRTHTFWRRLLGWFRST